MQILEIVISSFNNKVIYNNNFLFYGKIKLTKIFKQKKSMRVEIGLNKKVYFMENIVYPA